MTKKPRTGTGDWRAAFQQDIRYGIRMLWRAPGFSLAALLTLALGIGGNTAIFSITNALLLTSLPYERPQELTRLVVERRDQRGNITPMSLARFEAIRDRNRSFSRIAAFTNEFVNVTGREEPQQVPAARVTANFFDTLGVKAQAGRTFFPEESEVGGRPVVMISDSLWKRRFGGRRDAVGQNISLDAADYTIIGVLPAGFQFALLGAAIDIWSPRYFELNLASREQIRNGTGNLDTVARLRPGVSRAQATAEMELMNRQYRQEFPRFPDSDPRLSITVGNLQEQLVSGVRMLLLLLSGAVGLVLLIACANVASLLLCRALARKKEIAIRTALGARRGVLVRQLLTESVLLSLASGILGLALSYWATGALSRLGGADLLLGFAVGMDARVLSFTLAVSLITGLLFGMFPAYQLSRTDVNAVLRDEGRGTTGGRGRMQLRNLLVVGQVGVCMLLLICAGLLIRSFEELQSVDPGFVPHGLLSMNISLPTVKYASKEQQIAFFDETVRRVSTLPGVLRASVSSALPFNPKRFTPALVDGQPALPLPQRPFFVVETISPAYFTTMRIPLLAGRAFTERDHAQATKVLIVNQTLVRRYWPHENPLGKHVYLGRQTQATEVVGVAADVKNISLAGDPQPQFYIPFPQLPWGNMNLVVRTGLEPHQLVSPVQRQVYSIDASQPVTNVQTLEELLDASRAQPRFTMFLVAAFSLSAVVLAVVGIYGVMAYSVALRRPELGIRMALGAEKSDILRLVVGQGLVLTGAGVAVGLIGALASARVMSSLLFKVNIRDPATFVIAPVAFLLVGLLASYVPARRAISVDPAEALRHG